MKELNKTIKILYMCDCAGRVRLGIFYKSDNDWCFMKETKDSTLGFDSKHRYEWIDKKQILKRNEIDNYNPNRIPTHTGFDNYMVYWALEGKKVKDYMGWFKRVRIIKDLDSNDMFKILEGLCI